MTTTQPTTYSLNTSPPERLLPLAVIVPLLLAVTSVTLGAELVGGDPRSLARVVVRGLHARQVDREGSGRSSSSGIGEPTGPDVDHRAHGEERSA